MCELRKVQGFFCAFLLFCGAGRAQETFNKVFDYKNRLDFAFDIVQADTDYITITNAQGYNSGDNGILFSIFTSSGNLLKNKFFSKKGYSYYEGNPGTFFRTKDGGYAFGGALQINDGSYLSQAILVKYDSAGDTQWIKKYSYAGYDIAYQAIQTADGGYAVFGATALNGVHHQYYLIRTDSSGNLLWQKIYGGNAEAYGLSIALKSDNHLLLLGGQFIGTCYVPWFIETDDTGGVYKTTLLSNPFFECGSGAFRPTIDGGYLIWGATDSVIKTGNYQYPRYFAKLDTNLDVKWKTVYSASTIELFYNILQLPDSSYVTVGFHADPITASAFGWITKNDKNGKKLWQHDYYKRQDYDNYMADVQQTADKGYIITGTAWDSLPIPSQDIWLIRLDSNGCLIPGCDTAVTDVIEVTDKKNDLKIFPNPANDNVTILYNITLPNHAADLVIYDMEGKRIFSEPLDFYRHEVGFTTTQWPSGIYFCTIEYNRQRIKSKILVIAK